MISFRLRLVDATKDTWEIQVSGHHSQFDVFAPIILHDDIEVERQGSDLPFDPLVQLSGMALREMQRAVIAEETSERREYPEVEALERATRAVAYNRGRVDEMLHGIAQRMELRHGEQRDHK